METPIKYGECKGPWTELSVKNPVVNCFYWFVYDFMAIGLADDFFQQVSRIPAFNGALGDAIMIW